MLQEAENATEKSCEIMSFGSDLPPKVSETAKKAPRSKHSAHANAKSRLTGRVRGRAKQDSVDRA